MIPLLYLTDKANKNLIPDEKGVESAFAEAGIKIDVRVWDETDWAPYDNILIRTPWDYSLKPELFLQKIAEAARRGATVLHPEKTVRWNIDKRYLVELSEAGHKVVPTHVEDGFRAGKLEKYFARYGTLVLKPRVGAGGRDTFKVSPQDDLSCVSVLAGTSVLIQPFVPEIETLGEHSFIFFEEKFSHAVVKRSRRGEFRVQGLHGGTVHPYSPPEAEIDEVTRILKSAGRDTLYARVDAVNWNGHFHLMELEILEPELFFRFNPSAMPLFARAVRHRLKA
ncbi:MAG TPA: hypothetical protein DCZ92_09075 [Elusimicrobia bacterium]|nr:MAG: hypothetical protein A2016_05925 [Elusimicrobia bacterium GWF2_62_30]HBA60957.1 hypothetical protein [Elusimicrobiota bacterium]